MNRVGVSRGGGGGGGGGERRGERRVKMSAMFLFKKKNVIKCNGMVHRPVFVVSVPE